MRDWMTESRQRRIKLVEMAPKSRADLVAGAEPGDGAVQALVDRDVVLAGWMPTLRLLILRRSFWIGVLLATGLVRFETSLRVAIGR